MASIGGSIESVTIDGRTFSVPADAEIQRKIGGWENEILPNGNGTSRLIKSRVAWQLSGMTVQMDDSRRDHEYLEELSARPDYFAVAITLASGAIWQGTGQITGEMQANSQSAVAELSMSGMGQLSQQ